MTLEEYKVKHKLSYYVLGQQLGCSSINPAVMAQRYCSGKRFPRPKMILKIEADHKQRSYYEGYTQ
jgi:hypothetical protein